MKKIENLTIRGKSGKGYSFEVFSTETTFNHVSAVYVFSKRTIPDSTSSYKLLYIGESEELGARIANHEKWPCAQRHGVNAICVHRVNGQQNRLNVETDLRNAFNTPCNDQ